MSADRCQKQYRKLIEGKGFIEKHKKFDLFESRLDESFMDVLSSDNLNMREKVKLCKLLSYGNTWVECGFSLDEQVLEDIRVIGNNTTCCNEGGFKNVAINDQMMYIILRSQAMCTGLLWKSVEKVKHKMRKSVLQEND